MARRLSLCYAAPGHSLLNTSGTTRNILSLAQALSQWADVTVAFRRILEPIRAERFKVVAIERHVEESTAIEDDDATKGVNPFTHLSYLRTLRSFSKKWGGSCDVVLEKGWRLSGYLLDAFRRKGVPGALIENDVRFWSEPLHDLRTIAKYALHSTAQCVAGTCSRHAPVVIAETEELKTLLIEHRRVPPERIEVVELGVDHTLFRPMDQVSARNSLGISLDAIVLLYVGGMDKYHDLGPVIEALSQMESPAMQLHLVGDGEHRTQYEANRTCKGLRFLGRVPHHKVPEYIATSDLCIAPYCVHAFHNGVVTFSTLKIPEYMACGRPVVSIPSGPVKRLIKDNVSGFLFPNDVPSWLSFFKTLPSRDRLQEMGQSAARTVASRSWEKTAAQYFDVCQRLSGSQGSLTQ
jgi:glycosyltransferase involved in cell wall biosynthesis